MTVPKVRVRCFAHRLLQATVLTVAPGFAWGAGPWTAVGSTGVVDESVPYNGTRANLIVMEGATATLAATTATSTALLRFPVQDVFGLGAGFTARLSMGYVDSGASAQVKAVLRAVDLGSGQISNMLTLDSNLGPASSGLQTFSACQTPSPQPFGRFDVQSYWVEVTFTGSSSARRPAALTWLKIEPCP